MAKTTIEWCDHTINPIRARHRRTGARGYYCEKISPGCKHCYASTYQPRVHMPTFDQARLEDVEIFLDRKRLREVERRKKPTRYFWCDMTDMFGSWVRNAWIDECLVTMTLTPQHTHLILTKRIDRAFTYFMEHVAGGAHVLGPASARAGGAWKPPAWPLANVKLGVSIETQEYADKRLPTLLVAPVGGRFVSVEPQLEKITLTWAACSCDDKKMAFSAGHLPHCALSAKHHPNGYQMLDLVIIGAESGAGARPWYLQWGRSLIEQCHGSPDALRPRPDLEIPVFMKQLGSFPTLTPVGTTAFEANPTKIVRLKLKKRKGNDPSEWPDDTLKVREPMREGRAAPRTGSSEGD